MSLRSIVAVSTLGLGVGLFGFGALGCSSSGSDSSAGTTPTNQGVQAPTVDTSTASDVNPDGIPYPTANLGQDPRSGSHPGNIMRNFKFVGYKTTQGTVVTADDNLKAVSLADFFDPKQTHGYKVMHVTVSSVWCQPCNQETTEMVAAATDLASKGVLFVQALADGPAIGTGATVGDLDQWVKKHGVNFTQLLDPALKNFGPFFDAAAVPFNANVDLRSMEILTAGTGAPPDIAADVTRWVNWVNSNCPTGTTKIDATKTATVDNCKAAQ